MPNLSSPLTARALSVSQPASTPLLGDAGPGSALAPDVALLPPPAPRRHSLGEALGPPANKQPTPTQSSDLTVVVQQAEAPAARQPAGPDLLALRAQYQQRIDEGKLPGLPSAKLVPLSKNLGGVNLADVHELGRIKAARHAKTAVVTQPAPPLVDTTSDDTEAKLLKVEISATLAEMGAGITGLTSGDAMGTLSMVSESLASLLALAPEVYLLRARLVQRNEAKDIQEKTAQSLDAMDLTSSAIAGQLLPEAQRDEVLQYTGAQRTGKLRELLSEQALQAGGPDSLEQQRPIDQALEVLQLMQGLQSGAEVSAEYAAHRLHELKSELLYTGIGLGGGALNLGATVSLALAEAGMAGHIFGTVATGVGMFGAVAGVPLGMKFAIDNAKSARADAMANKAAKRLLEQSAVERDQANLEIKQSSQSTGLRRALARLLGRKTSVGEKTFKASWFATGVVNSVLGAVAFGLQFFGLAAAAATVGTVGAALGIGLAVGLLGYIGYKGWANKKAESRYSTEALERTVAGEKTELSDKLAMRQTTKLYNRLAMSLLQQDIGTLVKQAYAQAGGLDAHALREKVIDFLETRLHPPPYSPGERDKARALAQAETDTLLPDLLDARQGLLGLEGTLSQLKTTSTQWLTELNHRHASLVPASRVDEWVVRTKGEAREQIRAILHDFLPATSERIDGWFALEPYSPGRPVAPESFGCLILEQSGGMGRAAALRKLIRRDTEAFLWVCLRHVQDARARGNQTDVDRLRDDLSAFGLQASTWDKVISLDKQASATDMTRAIGLLKNDLAFTH